MPGTKQNDIAELVKKKWGDSAQEKLIEIRAMTLNEDDEKLGSFCFELCKQLGIKEPSEAEKGIFQTQCWRMLSKQKIPIKPNKFREFLKTQQAKKRESIKDDWKMSYGTYIMPPCTGYIVDLLRSGMNPLLVGPKGCGKTDLAKIIFKEILKIEFETIDISQNVTRIDLEGQMGLKNGETVWQDGLLAKACRNQRGILFNELDAANEDLATGLMELFQDHQYTLTQSGDRLNAEDSPLLATANTVGEGSNEMYTRQFIDKAFLSRIVPIQMDYLDAKTEEKILLGVNNTIRPNFAKKLVEFANWSRTAHTDGKITDVISTRELVQCVKMYQSNPRWDETAAIKICLCNRYAGPEHITVCGQAGNIFSIKDLEMNGF